MVLWPERLSPLFFHNLPLLLRRLLRRPHHRSLRQRTPIFVFRNRTPVAHNLLYDGCPDNAELY